MRRLSRWMTGLTALAALVAVVAILGACTPKSPEEKVAEARANYSANLNPNGFVLKQVPVETEEGAAEAGAAEAGQPEAAAGEAGEAGKEGGEAAPATRNDVILDILLVHRGDETLPGVTLDVSQVDSANKEKGHWRFYVDTSAMPPNTEKQITYTLHDVDYQQGDGFNVEVRHPIPPAERGDYREFAVQP